MLYAEADGTKGRSKRGTPTKKLRREQKLEQLINLCKKFVSNNKPKSDKAAKAGKDEAVKDKKRQPKRKLDTPLTATPPKPPAVKPPRHSSHQVLQVRL